MPLAQSDTTGTFKCERNMHVERRKVIRSKILRSTDVWEFGIKIDPQRRH